MHNIQATAFKRTLQMHAHGVCTCHQAPTLLASGESPNPKDAPPYLIARCYLRKSCWKLHCLIAVAHPNYLAVNGGLPAEEL